MTINVVGARSNSQVEGCLLRNKYSLLKKIRYYSKSHEHSGIKYDFSDGIEYPINKNTCALKIKKLNLEYFDDWEIIIKYKNKKLMRKLIIIIIIIIKSLII